MNIAMIAGREPDGSQKLMQEVVYDKDGVTLTEVKIMIFGEGIANCWQERHGSDVVVETHYKIPQWFERYKKLNEIL